MLSRYKIQADFQERGVFNPLEVARGILFTFKIASHQNDDYRDTAEEANVPLRHFDNRWMT